MIRLIIFIFVLASASGEQSFPPEGAFKNLDSVRQRYEDNRSIEEKKSASKIAEEAIWMSNASSKVKNYNSFTPDEIKRVWDNYENGKASNRALAFSLIASIEPLEKWLPDLKKLINSGATEDQMLAFSVISAYSRNSYGRFQEKKIFNDSEVLETVRGYTEQFKEKDEHFQRRVKKLQDSVEKIVLDLEKGVSEPKERIEKPLPNLEKIEETNHLEKQIEEQEAKAEKQTSLPWWVIGLMVLLAIMFLMIIGKSKR